MVSERSEEEQKLDGEIKANKAEIEANAAAIKEVEAALAALDAEIAQYTVKPLGLRSEDEKAEIAQLRDDKKQLRKKEEQLRDDKKQLRKKEEQLREKELLLMKSQKSNPPVKPRQSKRNAGDASNGDVGEGKRAVAFVVLLRCNSSAETSHVSPVKREFFCVLLVVLKNAKKIFASPARGECEAVCKGKHSESRVRSGVGGWVHDGQV